MLLSGISFCTAMHNETRPDATDTGGFSEDLLHELERVLASLRADVPDVENAGQQLALIRILDNVAPHEWIRLVPQFSKEGWLFLPLDYREGTAIKALHETIEKLVYQRDHDALTGLANRHSFERQLTLEIERAGRTQTEVSLIMVDMDHFKTVNDAYGQAAGDMVLARLGKLLMNSVRSYDVAARIGGEEFCLILPGASVWRAQSMARRILESFRKEEFVGQGGEVFTAPFSAGVATAIFHLDSMTGEELLAKADEALCEAKRNGRNRVAVSGPGRALSENPALVRADEKKFLFSLNIEPSGEEFI